MAFRWDPFVVFYGKCEVHLARVSWSVADSDELQIQSGAGGQVDRGEGGRDVLEGDLMRSDEADATAGPIRGAAGGLGRGERSHDGMIDAVAHDVHGGRRRELAQGLGQLLGYRELGDRQFVDLLNVLAKVGEVG